jgi:acyl-CoA thioesterase FadM
MPLVYERTFQVRHYECDAYGRLHHANLARFMQETAVAASANVGYDIARYEAMKRQWLIRESRLTV